MTHKDDNQKNNNRDHSAVADAVTGVAAEEEVDASDGDESASLSGKNKDTENFPVGSWLIRSDLRPHVHAFYDFARAADNISDDPLMDPADKIDLLTTMAVELCDESDTDDTPATRMRDSLAKTGVAPTHCLDLLVAFKRDAVKLRYATWAELLDYCRYSASPVGRYVLALHGIGEAAWPANDALCTALQIINHLQDCYDDYRELDRVYFPDDMLRAYGASTADLSRASSPKELKDTMDAMLDLLGPMMDTGRLLPTYVSDTRLKIETAIIASLADSMIAVLKKKDPLSDYVKLGKGAKVLAVLRGVKRVFL